MKFFKLKALIALFLTMMIVFVASCNKDFEDADCVISPRNVSSSVLELNFKLSSTTTFIQDDNTEYSSLEIAAMTPLSSSHSVDLNILKDGSIFMEITNADNKYPIKIPHQVPYDYSRKVHRTIISRGMVYFYDRSGREMASFPIELPSQNQLVRNIAELNNDNSTEFINTVLATMQSELFVKNLEEYIFNAEKNEIDVISYDDNYVILSKKLEDVSRGAEKDAVIIINREANRIAASRVYYKNDVLITNYYGYGPPRAPYLTSIKQITNHQLPSGRSVICQTDTKINNLRIKINS